MKKIQALWQFGRGSRTVPGVSLRKRSILCDLVIAGALLFYFGHGYAFAQDINSGLAGYWPCSDINDNTLADYSGNGHNGSFTGHPIWTVGKLTGALRFDGQAEYVARRIMSSTPAKALPPLLGSNSKTSSLIPPLSVRMAPM